MNYPIRLLTALAFGGLCARGADSTTAKTTYPTHVIGGTELRVLPSLRTDRQYQLHVSLPPGFREHPEKTYPVVFVTDGYWDFSTVVAAYGNLFYGKNVPEMLVVGLGYAGENVDYQNLRGDDLSPMMSSGSVHEGGHAQQFLRLIETVAIPLLEKEYRADPQHRYLMGCSAGGAFTLYAALTKPDLFQGYVADSPSVGGLFSHERTFAAGGRTIAGRVFISEAENEWPTYRKLIRLFHAQLEKDGIVKGGLKFRRVDNMRHAGGKPEVYNQGLLYVTAPIAPETGPQDDILPPANGSPAFGVIFWPKSPGAKITDDARTALRAHEAWLDQLSTEKRILGAGTTPLETGESSSGYLVFAKDRAEVEALAKTSPAVLSGSLDFDVMTMRE